MAGLDVAALSKKDGLEEPPDLEMASTSSEESAGPTLVPHWMRVTVDQIVGSLLDTEAVISRIRMDTSREPDQDIGAGSADSSNHPQQGAQ
jgi:hypothetical protein